MPRFNASFYLRKKAEGNFWKFVSTLVCEVITMHGKIRFDSLITRSTRKPFHKQIFTNADKKIVTSMFGTQTLLHCSTSTLVHTTPLTFCCLFAINFRRNCKRSCIYCLAIRCWSYFISLSLCTAFSKTG